MLELDVVQAAYGDSLILRYGTTRLRRTILVDGGLSRTYWVHLRGLLSALPEQGRQVDLAVVSHIDNDHVKGLLDYFSELRDRAENGEAGGRRPGVDPEAPMPAVRELWHNSFSVSAGGADIAPRIREVLNAAAGVAPHLHSLTGTLMGVAEGDALRVAAQALGVPINPRFTDEKVLLDASPAIRLAGMRIEVVGPSSAILERLREEWLRWFEKHGRAIAPGRAAAAADNKIPNLSSIVLLVRARRRTLLFTGDGRGDHIVAGLRERGLLPDGGTLHVDLLKVAHHGSRRNASEEFFRTVTADRYVISADGRYNNPDLECLLWIVDGADGRPIEIVCTNETDNVRTLVRQRPPAAHNYRLTIADPDASAHTIVLE